MTRLTSRFVLLTALLAVAPFATFAADEKSPPAATAPKLKQWIYVLRLVPRLHDDAAWTDADKDAAKQHFARLKTATSEGKVVLAGRTLEAGSKTFGIVIFESADEASAAAFMDADPAVVAKVMTAELHPYQVALQRSGTRVE